MKIAISFLALQLMAGPGFAENLRFTQYVTPIPAHTSFDVRWNAPGNPFPPQTWIYQLLPGELSPRVASNLMVLCSFTDKDRLGKGTLLNFKSSDGQRRLWISEVDGTVHYEVALHYSPTNLSLGIPSAEEAVRLAKNLLPKLGVNLADLDKKENSSEPDFRIGDSQTMFYVNHAFITNLDWRGVGFRRGIDGASFLSGDTGGNGDIRFGSGAQIIRIDLSWIKLERVKVYPTVNPDTIMKSLRDGKAVQGMLRMDIGDIDWRNVKTVTINKASMCYYAGNILIESEH